ncbi:hypothetical protein [Thiomicrorhabdus xiamenensis]|uniref:Uncharacterized protein n=1 Tax=Thiomicrorhabdus xiamenensis TaxID=2739063 RepID=A0A7D4TAJ2_9GAMM|nr:hypothetical protein [Thiomicrorhabdus xiamenensis]QKI89146.1 hypothetical protein HQN79_05990 [Thiomicrorhabdus xiamenensis]
MLCLFRNSRIHPKLNPWAILLSWIAVLFWLEFAFLEKELVEKIFAGHALIIDLLVGLPLVLAMAIMIYALVYWGIKVALIYLKPSWIVHIEPTEEELNRQNQLVEEAETEFGEGYWNPDDTDASDSKPKKNTSKESSQ